MELDEDQIQDGFTYVIDKRKNGVAYLKCKETRLHHCKGRGKIVAGAFQLTAEHNHAPDENAGIIQIFKHELRQMCMRRFDRQKDIYDELRMMHPQAAVIVTYPSIESTMRRWRKTIQPPIPQTLREYGGILDDPQWHRLLQYNQGTVRCATLSATDQSISVVFGDENFISKLSDCTEVFVDATYKVVPSVNGAYQFLTIMGTAHDHAVPFAWALMGRKSKSAYDCVLTYIQTVLAPGMAPTSFMTDFEIALRTSLQEVFVNATPHGCFFHYCQALYRRMRSLRLAEYVADNAEAAKLLRKLMALALLPADSIVEAFHTMRDNAPAAVRENFAVFLDYYDRQWLRRVTPQLFSVHGLVRRTNNCIESYHKVLLDKMSPHPNIWDFTKKLMNIQAAAHSDLLSLGEGRQVTRAPKFAYVFNHEQISRAWRKLQEGRITTTEFLEQASNFVSRLVRNLERAPGADERGEPDLVEAGVGDAEVAVAEDHPDVDQGHLNAAEEPEIAPEADIGHENAENGGPVPDPADGILISDEEDQGDVAAIIIPDEDEGMRHLRCFRKERTLQMERALKTAPADLRVIMEALVHDLTLALEESSNSANVRRRWGIRRRARSTGNIPSLSANKHSDDSSSSVCDVRIPKSATISKYQSDSDDTNQTKRFARFSNLKNINNIESDSVNENFAPRANTRRKRKFKRMAVDSDSNPSTSQTVAMIPNMVGKKKRVFRNDCENRYGTIWCGKRKRSCRERSTDCEMRSPKPSRNSKTKNRGKIQPEDAMDCSRISNSSISSSDSEAGIITNDEDREGDDEQSDWIGESSWWDDAESTNEEKGPSDPALQAILHGSFEHLTDEAKKNYRQRMQWIRDGLSGREIRAGRRRVDNKPGYSIITSANEKVSRFLQDPSQSELKLHPMRQPEREKLRRLANLYSLSLKGDLSCPILYKTRHTTQAICVDQVSLNRLSDYKRLRKTPPNSPNPDSEMPDHEQPNTETNFSTQMSNQMQSIGSVESLAQAVNLNWDIPNSEVQMKPKFHSFGHSKSS